MYLNYMNRYRLDVDVCYRVMKDVGQFTRVTPNQRQQVKDKPLIKFLGQ